VPRQIFGCDYSSQLRRRRRINVHEQLAGHGKDGEALGPRQVSARDARRCCWYGPTQWVCKRVMLVTPGPQLIASVGRLRLDRAYGLKLPLSVSFYQLFALNHTSGAHSLSQPTRSIIGKSLPSKNRPWAAGECIARGGSLHCSAGAKACRSRCAGRSAD
jgi:hypothetical protein